jgi:predicted RNA-binding protein with TRAM domain
VNSNSSHGRFGRPRGFGFSGPKPVEVGKEYDVTITEVSRRGDGVARIKGFVIFVPGAKTGSKERIRITRVAQRYANAEIVTKSKEESKSEE